MRCPSCGTENAPGSRFCGGCGAKIAVSARLAPTQKITDDAGYPQPPAPPIMPATVPGLVSPRSATPTPYTPGGPPPGARLPQSAPRSQSISSPPPYAPAGAPPGVMPSGPRSQQAGVMPPGPRSQPGTAPPPWSPAPGTLPPANGAARSAARPRTAQLEDPASSLPTIARRPWGLIVVVLMLDAALAAAGGWMLSVGIDAPSVAPAAPASTTQPTATPSAKAAPPPTATAAAAVPIDAGITGDARATPDAGSRDASAPDARARPASNAPTDPYGDSQTSDPLPPETK